MRFNTILKPLTPNRNDRVQMVCSFNDYRLEHSIHIPNRKGREMNCNCNTPSIIDLCNRDKETYGIEND